MPFTSTPPYAFGAEGPAPAYFLSLTLENVRCFGPEQTLDLSDGDGDWAQWTVLLGDNGTGKTTLLQALARMKPVVNVYDRWIDWYHFDVEPIFLRWNQKRQPFYRGGSPTSDLLMRAKIIIPAEKPLRPWYEYVHPAGEEPKYHSAEYGPYDPEPTRRIGSLYVGYGAARRMSQEGFEETDESGVEGLFSSRLKLPNAHDWLLQTDYAAKSGKATAEKRLQQIKHILADPKSGILPDVDAIRFAEQEGDVSPPRVEFHTPYGWVTLDRLSLGYRTMIAWVVDLARRLFERYPDMDNPLEGPAVCLVDEIDLHLHPKWQRKITGWLSERFPNTQFIVTAHSPLVVQAAEDANVAVLRRVENEAGDDYVEILNDMQPIRNLRVDQILTSDLYGLESARPPQIEAWMEERKAILSQSELSDEDERRLAELEEKIGDLPAGETKKEREAIRFLQDLSSDLRGE